MNARNNLRDRLKYGGLNARVPLGVNLHEKEPTNSTSHFPGVGSFVGWMIGVVISGHPTSRRGGPLNLDLPVLVRGKLWV